MVTIGHGTENNVFSYRSYWKAVDVGSVLNQLNLREFEEQFQIRSKPTLSNVTKILKKKVVTLSILDSNRARNAMIIQRRVALPAADIARSVEETDLAKLPGTFILHLNFS